MKLTLSKQVFEAETAGGVPFRFELTLDESGSVTSLTLLSDDVQPVNIQRRPQKARKARAPIVRKPTASAATPAAEKAPRIKIDPVVLRDLWGKGKKVKEIAKMFGCSDMTVYNTLKKHGIHHDAPERTSGGIATGAL